MITDIQFYPFIEELIQNDSIKIEKSVGNLKFLNNLIIVEAKINSITAYFLVDSGCTINILHSAHKKKYQFTEGTPLKVTLNGLNGSQELYSTSNLILELSEKYIRDPFACTDLSYILDIINKDSKMEVVGIISGALLRNHKVVLNYSDQTLKFAE